MFLRCQRRRLSLHIFAGCHHPLCFLPLRRLLLSCLINVVSRRLMSKRGNGFRQSKIEITTELKKRAADFCFFFVFVQFFFNQRADKLQLPACTGLPPVEGALLTDDVCGLGAEQEVDPLVERASGLQGRDRGRNQRCCFSPPSPRSDHAP